MAAYYDRKDYSRPLHVDCSVEYELPNAAKPPAGARLEPLLMIHPCYYRRTESQRRSPFINNLPATSSQYQQQRGYAKRDPMLCGSSGDSGIGALWDSASPGECRLRAGPDSGIVPDKSTAGLTSAITGMCHKRSLSASRSHSTSLKPTSAPCWETAAAPTPARLYGSSRCQTNADSNRELRDATNQGPRHGWAVPNTGYLSVNCGAEVNNNHHSQQHHQSHHQSHHHQQQAQQHHQSHHQQQQQQIPSQHQSQQQVGKAAVPAVAVAAVAACKACQPQFLQPQQRAQQPWPAATAAAACQPSNRHRVCGAVEPGPEHGAWPLSRRPPPPRPPPPSRPPPAKRSRLLPPPATAAASTAADCCKVCSQWSYPDDNSRLLWSNDTVLRLYQV